MWWLLLLLALLAVPAATVALLKPSVLASVGVIVAVMLGLVVLALGLAYIAVSTVVNRSRV